MKRENIKIAIAGKEEALAYKVLLEKLGEKVSSRYWEDLFPLRYQNALVYWNSQWTCGNNSLDFFDDRQVVGIDELIAVISPAKEKVVQVNNHVEYGVLLRSYREKGWRWQGGTKVTKHVCAFSFPAYVSYKPDFTVAQKPFDCEIIPFESLNLKGPDRITEDGMPLWYGDNFYGVYYSKEKGWEHLKHHSGSYTLNKTSPDNVETIKLFSTEQAAAEWADKHRMICRSEDGHPLAYGDSYFCAQNSSKGWNRLFGSFVLDEGSGIITNPEYYKAFKDKGAAELWVEKQRSVLLTSEDGVELKEGAFYFCAFRLGGEWDIEEQAMKLDSRDAVIHSPKDFKAFLFKKNAEEFVKKQKVVLTTEDGVGLTEESPVYVVWRSFGTWAYTQSYTSVKEKAAGYWNVNPRTKDSDRKLFSTKEAAEAWVIKHNKPVLLTTVDGVVLKEGDTYFKVFRPAYASKYVIIHRGGIKITDNVVQQPEKHKAFKSKEAAEAWVAEKVKPVMLITVDGVSLREGGEWWGVSNVTWGNTQKALGFWELRNPGKPYKLDNNSICILFPDQCKAFSTKEAAEAWIAEQNNPVWHTTVDGVPLRENDLYYFISKYSSGEWSKASRAYKLEEGDGVMRIPENFKAFYSKEAADAWVAEQNKPVLLTTVDGVPLKAGDSYYHVYFMHGEWDLNSYRTATSSTDIFVMELYEDSEVISDTETNKAFHNKEAAEKWIAGQNCKPLLTVDFGQPSADLCTISVTLHAELKPVLLTSMDDKRLREGDKYFKVFKNLYDKWVYIDKVYRLQLNDFVIRFPKENKAFVDQKAAEAWAAEQNKPVLITTVDGVPLKEGDEYFHTYKLAHMRWQLNKCGENGYIYKLHISADVLKTPDRDKAFSTKEAAEKWIAEKNSTSAPKITKTNDIPIKNGWVSIREDKVVVYQKDKLTGYELTKEEIVKIYNQIK